MRHELLELWHQILVEKARDQELPAIDPDRSKLASVIHFDNIMDRLITIQKREILGLYLCHLPLQMTIAGKET